MRFLLTILLCLWCSLSLGANNIWNNSQADNDGDDGDNWSLSRVPIAGDVMYFDNTSDDNCTFTASEELTCDGINVTSQYDGNIDLGDRTRTYTIGSDGVVCDGAGTFDCGDNTIAITDGPFDNKDQSTWTYGTSTVSLAGTCTYVSNTDNETYDLTVVAGGTTTVTMGGQLEHKLTVDGTLSINTGVILYAGTGGATEVIINTGGSITGAGTLNLFYLSAGANSGITTQDGTVDVASLKITQFDTGATPLVAGTYASPVTITISTGARALNLLSGTYNFDGGLELECTGSGSLTLDNSTNDPTIVTTDLTIDDQAGTVTITDTATAVDWTITGNMAVTGTGTFTWNAGTSDPAVTFSGTATQSIELDGQNPGDVEVNKSAGTLTCADGWTVDSYTQTDGTVDFNSQTLTSVGNWTFAAGADGLAANLPGCTLTVGGDFSVTGTDATTLLDMTAASAWTLTVTGSATASYVDVSYSDASGGTEIDATTDCKDSLNNDNWDFAIARALILFMRRWGRRFFR